MWFPTSQAKALKSLNRAIELAPGQAAWHYRRAAELARLGRPAEALADFDWVAALMPGQTDANDQRAIQLSRLARDTEALEALDEFLSCLPPNPDALLLRGAELVELGRHLDALEVLDEVLAGDPGHAAAHHRAITLPRLGRHEEALAAHDRAAGSAPEQISFRVQKRKALTAAATMPGFPHAPLHAHGGSRSRATSNSQKEPLLRKPGPGSSTRRQVPPKPQEGSA